MPSLSLFLLLKSKNSDICCWTVGTTRPRVVNWLLTKA